MKTKTLIFLALSSVVAAREASAAALTLGIEPIVAYERVQEVLPSPHFTDRISYGARIRAGIPLVSAEGEYLRGQDNETFPSLGLTTKDTDDKIKLGLRSSLRMTSLFSVWARGGGQARRNTHVSTQGGISTTTVGKWIYKPYAGLGLTSRLGRNFELDGGVTAVFNDFPHMASNEYETTLGFVVRFP